MTELRDPSVAPNLSSTSPGLGDSLHGAVGNATADQPDEVELATNPRGQPTAELEAARVPWRAPTRPTLGPALWLGGATLWAYVVAGQFVVLAGMPEVLGLAFVCAVFVSAAFLAVSRTLELMPATGAEERKARVVRPAAFGVGFALAAIVFAAMLGSSSSDTDGLAMLGLMFLGGVGVIAGKRFTGRPLERVSGGRRAFGIALWVMALGLTLMVVASAVH